jgi:defect-in-organelle-trafficking protein DotB
VLYRISRHAWSASEIDLVLIEIYRGAHAQTEIKSQRALDFSYELNLADGSKQRFRVNATGIFGRDGFGVEITLRVLPAITPDMASVGLSEAEMSALTPRDGLVVIAGATGSGKSTTMAAVTRAHLENSERTVKIVDIQAPIEYTYRDVRLSMTGSSSMIGQSEIGKHLKCFADGVHSALRRKPHIINVGEARDFATISASLEACLTGHLVYTTTHAGSVSETMRRLLSTFPANERESRAYDLVSGLRFVDRVREKLLSSPMQSWPTQLTQEVSGLVPDTGSEDMRMCLADVAAQRYRQGMISRSDALQLGGAQAVRDNPEEAA